MKLNKRILKEAIKDVLSEEGEVPQQKRTSREKKVAAGVETGGLMSAEEYANTLKSVLLSKVSEADRKKALVAVFGNKASVVLQVIRVMLKQGA